MPQAVPGVLATLDGWDGSDDQWQPCGMPTPHLPGHDVLIAEGPFAGRLATVAEIKGEHAIVTLTVFDRVVTQEVDVAHLLPPPDSGDGTRILGPRPIHPAMPARPLRLEPPSSVRLSPIAAPGSVSAPQTVVEVVLSGSGQRLGWGGPCVGASLEGAEQATVAGGADAACTPVRALPTRTKKSAPTRDTSEVFAPLEGRLPEIAGSTPPAEVECSAEPCASVFGSTQGSKSLNTVRSTNSGAPSNTSAMVALAAANPS